MNVSASAGFGLLIPAAPVALTLLTGQLQATTAAPSGFDPAQFAGVSPLTTALFWVFVAYQIAYAALVLRAAQPAQGALK